MLRSSPGISVTWPTRGRSVPRKDLRGQEVMTAGAFQFFFVCIILVGGCLRGSLLAALWLRCSRRFLFGFVGASRLELPTINTIVVVCAGGVRLADILVYNRFMETSARNVVNVEETFARKHPAFVYSFQIHDHSPSHTQFAFAIQFLSYNIT